MPVSAPRHPGSLRVITDISSIPRLVRICWSYRSETSTSGTEVQPLTTHLWTAVGDLVKTTLGPKGMDKILQSAYASTYAAREISSDNW